MQATVLLVRDRVSRQIQSHALGRLEIVSEPDFQYLVECRRHVLSIASCVAIQAPGLSSA
jgi:hypothetical protein